MNAGHLFMRTDDTTGELASGSNLSAGPDYGVFETYLLSNFATRTDGIKSGKPDTSPERCIRGNSDRPPGCAHVTRLPVFFSNHAVNVQVSGARADVEPFV